MKSNIWLKLYLIVSGAVFLLVGILHLLRLIYHAPVMAGGVPIPQALSYAGFPVATACAFWAFGLLRKQA